MNKYYNKKTEYKGMKYDSKRELKRYQELELLQRAGEIKDLQRQVKYILIPKLEKQRECSYTSDFEYCMKDKDGNSKIIVEDCKGYKTEVYKIKKKLMKWIHNIDIVES